MGKTQYRILNKGAGVLTVTPSDIYKVQDFPQSVLKGYPTLSALVADQVHQLEAAIYVVLDGSGFTGVTSGYVYVEYIVPAAGTPTGTEVDYRILTSASKDSNDHIIANDKLFIVKKTGGNADILEVGDFVKGLVEGTYIEAIYVGPDSSLLSSFSVVQEYLDGGSTPVPAPGPSPSPAPPTTGGVYVTRIELSALISTKTVLQGDIYYITDEANRIVRIAYVTIGTGEAWIETMTAQGMLTHQQIT